MYLYSNCFIYALTLYISRGGYLRLMRSERGSPIPRLLWSEDNDTWYYFAPSRPQRYRDLPWYKKIIAYHVLWYEGSVKQIKL